MGEGHGRLIAGRYRLIELLGSGGMGQVWKARDETLNLDVAVKEIHLDAGGTDAAREEAKRRALAEARNAAALRDHPNIVAIHDAVLDDGVPWTVMRLVQGRSLAEELAVRGTLHPDEVARIAADLLSALAAAHTAGIIHRDVKPQNIMLDTGGNVLLADFGIAKNHADTTLTATGMFVGSLEYLAPERLNGQEDTPAVDLFSLGATLYEAVEGTSPFRRATPAATMAALAFEPLPTPKRAGPLEPLISALLERDPEARPNTAEALGILAGGPAPTIADVATPTQTAETLPWTSRPATSTPLRPGPPPVPMSPTQPASGPAGTRPAKPSVYAGVAGLILVVLATGWMLWPNSGPGKTGAGAPAATVTGTPTPTATTVTSPITSTPAYTPSTTAPTTPAAPAPTPMSAAAVNRAFTNYMNGLVNHDMTRFRAATCPRLQSTLLGFELNGYYITRWTLKPFTIPPDADQLSVDATLRQQDPSTGQDAGQVDNQWIVERDSDGQYWVCGWLNGQ